MARATDNYTVNRERSTLKSTRLLRVITLVEDSVLVALLSGMILIAAAQILLRNFFDMGLAWGDQALRVLVLWLALVGAVVSSRENKHINMDVLLRYFAEPAKRASRIIVGLFTFGVCAVVAYYSARFVYLDYQMGMAAFGNFPAWILELILPLGFGLIAIRYLVFSVEQLQSFTSLEGRH
ncbi:MAG TPA: TRAP transporter small permease [Candidatus Binatia bacterium]|nr:TRAP transporter small permease [Candidatus Binatia bacterium]